VKVGSPEIRLNRTAVSALHEECWADIYKPQFNTRDNDEVSKICMWNSRYNWNRQFCACWSQWKHVCWELVHSHCLQFAFVVACVDCIVIHSYILFKGKVQNRKVCWGGGGVELFYAIITTVIMFYSCSDHLEFLCIALPVSTENWTHVHMTFLNRTDLRNKILK
jgi:hypothetical protein